MGATRLRAFASWTRATSRRRSTRCHTWSSIFLHLLLSFSYYPSFHTSFSNYPSVRGEGPRDGPVQLLRPVQVDQAVAADPRGRQPRPAEGRVPAVEGGPQKARRHVRVHPLRMLLHLLPIGNATSRNSPLPNYFFSFSSLSFFSL